MAGEIRSVSEPFAKSGGDGAVIRSGGACAPAKSSVLSVLLAVFIVSASALLPCKSRAAFEGIVVDSKSAAMGDCWSSSEYGLHLLAPVPPACVSLSGSICYSAPYGIPELAQKTVLLNFPLRTDILTLGLLERGGSLYKESALSASISHSAFPAARVVLSLGVFSMSIAGHGQSEFVSLGVGLRSRPIRSLEACIGLGNLTSNSASGPDRGALPSTFLLGMVFRPSEKVTAAGEVRKTPGKESSSHLGVELAPQNGIRMRFGLQTLPVELAMGFSIEIGPLSIESASSFHSVLGRTDTVTLTFRSSRRNPPPKDRAR